MDNGQPNPKRPRLIPPPGSSWSSEPHNTISLPPPRPQANYQQGQSPHNYPQESPEAHRVNPEAPHNYIPPPPAFNGTRELMMKRDPGEGSPPIAYNRPPAAGNGQDYHLNAEDNRAHLGPHFAPRSDHSPISAGPNFRSNNFPPPPSLMSATPGYDHSPIYGHGLGPPRDAYPATGLPYNTPIATTAKRKAQRAAQACDSCRTLKAKCDEGRPDCGSCKEKGIKCIYRDPPPKQVDKTTNDILEAVWRIEENLKRNSEALAGLEDVKVKVEQISRDHEQMKSTVYSNVQSENLHHESGHYSRRPTFGESHELPSRTPIEGPADEEALTEDEAGEPVAPGKSSIPVNHTTGAARLLLCGPIAEISKGVLKNPKVYEKFPMWQEERRGCLRIFGRGEGNDIAQGYDRDPLTDHGDDSASADASSDISSPAAGEEWGQVGGMTPPGSVEVYHGAVDAYGMPDFDRSIVLKYVKAFKENINNLHPLLVPTQLDALTENFLKSIPDGNARPKQVEKLSGGSHVAGFVSFGPNPQSPGNKRKRSPQVEGSEAADAWGYKPGHPFRTISSALVLMVLALGKIILHNGKLPDVYNDRNIDPTFGPSPPVVRNGHSQSPMQTSPILPGFSPDGSSPQAERAQPRSRRTSVEGGSNPLRYPKKNMDIIPGLPYFALATDIIGNQLGGNSLQHAHVNILAGLFHAQLARPIESYAYIQKACLVVQFLMRPKLERFKKITHSENITLIPKRDNPLIFTFWTCLQLESDILAELPCPHSGILNFEEDMPSPNLQAASEEGFEGRVLTRYQQQLMMRKHLNMLHGMFYKPNDDDSQPSKHFPTIKAVEDNLHNLVNWNEDDPPSNDILDARLRAKYYGAQVITYRPFLLKILEHSAMKTSRPGWQVSSDFKSGIDVPSINTGPSSADEINPKALFYAKECIKTLIKSTSAFHGIAEPGEVRLIVTNVWGTAHAQWGNCLVLQAAYMDPVLKPVLLDLISVDDLRSLVTKTIGFLKLMTMPSCALSTDYKILEAAAYRTKLLTKPSPLSSSFTGSNNSGEIS